MLLKEVEFAFLNTCLSNKEADNAFQTPACLKEAV